MIKFVSQMGAFLNCNGSGKEVAVAVSALQRFSQEYETSTIDQVCGEQPIKAILDKVKAPPNQNHSNRLGKLWDATMNVMPYCLWTPGYDEEVVGLDFKNYFSYATLVGPSALIECSYLSAGITLAAPAFFYNWHCHPAIELYVNLTNNAFWGLDKKPLVQKELGDIIVHSSMREHAMFSADAPLLAPWIWVGDVKTPAIMC